MCDSEFWETKRKRNIERDTEVNIKLHNNNWIVLKFWGDDIKKNIAKCLDTILYSVKMERK